MFAYTAGALRLFSYSFLLVGFNLCSAGFLNAMEKPGKALVISLGRGIVVITTAIYLMSALLGESGLWMATTISEGIVLAVNIALVLTVLITDKNFHKQKESLRA